MSKKNLHFYLLGRGRQNKGFHQYLLASHMLGMRNGKALMFPSTWVHTAVRSALYHAMMKRAVNSTATQPAKETALNGGRGGQGGDSDLKGGMGGLGEGPRLGAAEAAALFKEINGGIGGAGGTGRIEGGAGGTGQRPDLSVQSLHIDGMPVNVPTLTIADFCARYKLSPKIHTLLDDAGFETAGGLLEVSNPDLVECKFKIGHIFELRRALKQWSQAISKK
ncbi:hypothetical protein C8R43DRAFT_1000647 [Mycena crocata]|nr:hypothetical protein C8R43DRAFT_1000647 [Mycena crocata]